MTDKRDFLLELAVFCLALTAAGSLTTGETLPGGVTVVGTFAALGIALATGTLVLYEVATFDVGR